MVVIAAVDADEASSDNILRSLDTGTTRRIKNMTIGIRRSLSAVMT